MSAQADNSKTHCAVVRLKNRRDFLRLRSGKRYSTGSFTLQSGKSPEISDPDTCRVGFTVTTKIGNSVERNRIKRRLRAASNDVFPLSGQSGMDYALIAKRRSLTGPYDAIVRDLKLALDHLHANRAKGSSKHLPKNPSATS